MKLKFEDGYIAIISPKLTYTFGLLSGAASSARAAAFFPFIIFRSEDEKVFWVINHEKIHFRQQLETLFIGSIFISIFEIIYAKSFLRKGLKESYLWSSAEQEAYRNQHNQHYLKTRPLWQRFKYVSDKKILRFGSPGEVFVDDVR